MHALFRLIRFRNSHPAFDGGFVAIGCEKRIALTWTALEHLARLDADPASGEAEVTWTAAGRRITARLSVGCAALAPSRPFGFLVAGALASGVYVTLLGVITMRAPRRLSRRTP